MAKRVAYYLNQFFGGIGGEEAADIPLQLQEGVVGPGIALQRKLGGEAQITVSFVCGDNYFNQHSEVVISEICRVLKERQIDLLVAGPAFNAGRYGVACGAICSRVHKELRIPVISGMYPGNPAVDMYKKDVLIVATKASAAGMRDAVDCMARLSKKLLSGGEIFSASEEGYVARGIRLNQLAKRPAAARAVAMLHRKLRGEPFESEVRVQQYDHVPPARPIEDLSKARIALVTEAGIVPFGNPDRIKHANADNWASYSLQGIMDLECGKYEVVHGGFDAKFANEDPDRVLPVDALRYFEQAGYIGALHDTYWVTVGNGMPVERSQEIGAQIAQEVLAANVDGVLIPSS